MVNEIVKAAINEESSITIVPNVVTTGQVNVILTNQPKGEYYFLISNKIGQILNQSKVIVNNDKFIHSIKTGNIANGTYQLTSINSLG